MELEDSFVGNPVIIGGKQYGHGLAAVVNSEIEYELKGLYDTFSAQVGVDDAANDSRAVVFSVVGDGKELWHSEPMRKADGLKTASVSVAGVQRLVLRVAASGGGAGSGGGRRGRDQADWAEMKVTRSGGAK